MTKKMLLEYIEEIGEDEEIDLERIEREYLRECSERRKEWLDDYYQETAYGWYQQDIIDMYRRER